MNTSSLSSSAFLCQYLLKAHFLPQWVIKIYLSGNMGLVWSNCFQCISGIATFTRTELLKTITCATFQPYMTFDLWRALPLQTGTCSTLYKSHYYSIHSTLTADLKPGRCSTINVHFLPHWFKSAAVLLREKKLSKLCFQRSEQLCIMLRRGLATELKSQGYNEHQGIWRGIMSVEIIFPQSCLFIVCLLTQISDSIVKLKIGWKLVKARANEMLPSITSAATKQTNGRQRWFEWAISHKLTCVQRTEPHRH